MRKSSLPILAILIFANGCVCRATAEQSATDGSDRSSEKNLIILRNDKAVLGVWSQAGGRVVLYRAVGGENILLADSKHWAKSHAIPEPTPQSGFTPYNGHIIWVGPQKDWWTQQTINEKRRKRKAVWPPDPYLVLAPYKVAKRTADSLELIGPESPVSGVQLTKMYELNADGSVLLTTSMKNMREEAVSWDIWSNTRLPGAQYAFVPISTKDQRFRVHGALPLQTLDGFAFFRCTDRLPKGKRSLSAKLFVQPRQGVLASFGRKYCFIKRSTIVSSKNIHPDHAFAEIFQCVDREPSKSLLELEFHSAHKTLKPGESMRMEETWQLLPNPKTPDPATCVSFLKKHVMGTSGK